MDVSREALLPDPQCELCGTLSLTHPEMSVETESNLSPIASSTRRLPLKDLKIITQPCIGAHIGIVQQYAYDLQLPLAVCSAWQSITTSQREPTLGRASRFDDARGVAVIEAMERYAGFFGANAFDTLFTSFNRLGDDALHPKALGLHEDPLYDEPNFPFHRFHPDLPIHWVKGLNLSRSQIVWVPRSLVFYGVQDNDVRIAFETSNGCAVGSSFEEAVLHGLIELVERDAFLMCWYLQIAAPQMDENILRTSSMQGLLSRFRLLTGANILFFNSTMEHGIPSVIVLACGTRPEQPATAASAGAGLTLEAAAEAALRELVGHYIRLDAALHDKDTLSRAKAMFANNKRVLHMEDHGLVNALPESRQRFAFLVDQLGRAPIQGTGVKKLGSSPKEWLDVIIGHLDEHKFSVIAVDQTIPALRAIGLHAVKVLVPGLLPMTFGHTFRRTDVSRLDHMMGQKASLNLIPHPFP
jgi:ribosomal protein S12 methylthiotransferase accessory factor